MKSLDWYKAATRELPYYMSQHAMHTFSLMNKKFGFPFKDIIFDWNQNVLTIFRSKKQVESTFITISEMSEEEIIYNLEKTHTLYSKILDLCVGKLDVEKFSQIHKILIDCWQYHVFSIFFSYGSHIKKLKAIQDKNYALFKKVRDIGNFYKVSAYFRNNIQTKFDPLLMDCGEILAYFNDHIEPLDIDKRLKQHYVLLMEDYVLRKAKPNEIDFESLYKQTKTTNKIIGTTACKGTKTGIARIVMQQKDLKKLRAEDILVTTMTSPSFLPYITEAGGIITDDGGTTSHASILSREFNIPCITGTKIATNQIKEGDKLLLDATQGYVKILNKQNK